MELFYMVLGCMMFYAWIHSAFILFPLIGKLKGYDKFISVVSVVFTILLVIGITIGE